MTDNLRKMKREFLLFVLICLVSTVRSNNYEVTVFTANINWAGTGSAVFIVLYGRNSNSHLLKLPSTKSNFNVGGIDKFTLHMQSDLGEIYKIKVCQDWTGAVGPSWLLNKVIVKAEHSTESVFFINKWLEKKAPNDLCVIAYQIPKTRGECGTTISSSRVVNGHTSKPQQWGWQAQLKIHGHANHWCGGTLIHPSYVLTAAHCVSNVNTLSLIITLGEHDLTKSDGTEQTFDTAEIITHPDYNPKTKENDFALIKLKKAAILNSAVRVACLPDLNDHLSEGKSCYVTGWGKVSHPGVPASVLQQAELPTVSNDRCNKDNGEIATIKESMLCAGGNAKSGCHGDSGGPFVCLAPDGRYVLQGVTSWGGSKCETSGRYTVFSRVTHVLEWMLSLIYSKHGNVYSN